MLAIDDRREILDRFLAREYRREKVAERKERLDSGKARKTDVRWLIMTETVDIEVKNKILNSLISNTNDWIVLAYKGGYLFPFYTSLNLDSYTDERKQNLCKRLQTWKRLRPYLISHNITENRHMYPAEKRCIFHFRAKDAAELQFACNVFIQMMLNYIPLYNMYMYDPVPGGNHGYRYYSGEPVIVYYLGDAFKNNRSLRHRWRTIIADDKANGYDLKDVWKIVLCTFDWKALDDERGAGPFKIFVVDPRCGDICQQCMLYWKDYTGDESFFSAFKILSYAATEKVLPWPYSRKDDKLDLLDSVKPPDF